MELLEKYGWYNKNSLHRTQPVGSLKPNDLGLFDLHGNILEWCQERYIMTGKESQRTQLTLERSVNNKNVSIVRGGTFGNPPESLCSGLRYLYAPTNAVNGSFGFRPARTYH